MARKNKFSRDREARGGARARGRARREGVGTRDGGDDARAAIEGGGMRAVRTRER